MTSGNSSIKRWHSVVLPAPDGDETTINSPRAASFISAMSLHVLDLLAQPLELGLGVDHAHGHRRRLRLGADGVDLAVELLGQKIEPPAIGLGAVAQALTLDQVRRDPRQLLGDVGSVGEN